MAHTLEVWHLAFGARLPQPRQFVGPLPRAGAWAAVLPCGQPLGLGLQELNIREFDFRHFQQYQGGIFSKKGSIRVMPSGTVPPWCVVFDLDGELQFRDLEATNVCLTYRPCAR